VALLQIQQIPRLLSGLAAMPVRMPVRMLVRMLGRRQT
jgi:hypothetical protein